MTTEPEPRVGEAVKRYHQQVWPTARARVTGAAWRILAKLEEDAKFWGMATFRFPAIPYSDWQDEMIVFPNTYQGWQYQDAEYKHNGFIYRMRFGSRQPSEPLPGRNAAAHMLSIGGVS